MATSQQKKGTAATKQPPKSAPGKPGKAVATKPKASTAVVAGGYEDDIGAGFDNLGREDYAIPFLVVLQPLSPQVDDESPQYVEGAETGSILNTVTKALFDGDEGITIVPVHRIHQFLEWIPRDDGGGLVGIHAPEATIVTKARQKQAVGKIPMDNGHELTESFSLFCLLLDDDGNYQQAIINFQSTQIKVYRQLMTRAAAITMRTDDNRLVQPPLFAHRYRLTTVKQENKKGKWHGWVINFDGDDAESARLAPDSEIYQAARAFRSMVQTEGQRIVAARTEEVAAGNTGGDGSGDEM